MWQNNRLSSSVLRAEWVTSDPWGCWAPWNCAGLPVWALYQKSLLKMVTMLHITSWDLLRFFVANEFYCKTGEALFISLMQQWSSYCSATVWPESWWWPYVLVTAPAHLPALIQTQYNSSGSFPEWTRCVQQHGPRPSLRDMGWAAVPQLVLLSISRCAVVVSLIPCPKAFEQFSVYFPVCVFVQYVDC